MIFYLHGNEIAGEDRFHENGLSRVLVFTRKQGATRKRPTCIETNDTSLKRNTEYWIAQLEQGFYYFFLSEHTAIMEKNNAYRIRLRSSVRKLNRFVFKWKPVVRVISPIVSNG